ncbi:Ankrd17 [Symbiodinium pilosum]|uniref:Ankrd17 protein n=1 Tax=Symbiodinium pilosum TaxID=2952 RepID=A0A812M7W7_SYMPI|nr:Ankrd17 [Symbiodinium pilosum]
MLRISRMSGDELAAVSLEEARNVLALKQALCRLHHFPVCLQHVLQNGTTLDDATKLVEPMDLQLVMLSTATQQDQAENEFRKACKDGCVQVAEFLLEADVHTDIRDIDGSTALMAAAEANINL